MISQALAVKPDSPDAHYNTGMAWHSLGEYENAIASFRKAITLRPDDPQYHFDEGNALQELERFDEALACYDRALRLEPDFAAAHNNRGVALKELKRLQEALTSYDRAISLQPRYAEAHSNRGNALAELKRFDEAVASHTEAIRLRPDYAEAHSNRGNALKSLKRYDEALRCYEDAISLRPDYAEAYYNRGNAFFEINRVQEALTNYEKAIAIRPDYAEAHRQRGGALVKIDRLENALVSFDEALRADPGLPYLQGQRLHLKMKVCDWAGFADGLSKIEDDILAGKKAISPWLDLSLFDNGELQLAVASSYVKEEFDCDGPPVDWPKPRAGGKIRIGYYSAEFHEHATTYLVSEFLDAHDRDRFEIYGFSSGPQTDDRMRRRVAAACDRFVEINDMSDRDVAVLSREMGIDIAIAINGYTSDARLGAFAERCAPIQVNFLGHAGTMGAPFIDYIIADRVLIPEENKKFHSEKTVWLPGCYQPNDSQREISSQPVTRAQYGLPESGFVFACFNNSYKITPHVFDCWMRILRRVDRSMLWMIECNKESPPNLRREAEKRGINPDRLVFAERAPLAEHLARHRLADLFIDTYPYTAHTTASDALWAGLPVLTTIGNTFAARVSASLLTALDMPELIANDIAQYEDMSVALANDPARLAEIRKKLAHKRVTNSLFNGKVFAAHIEAAYAEMHQRRRDGLPPDHFLIQAAAADR